MANLENYETVAERIEKFWVKYPNGRIDVKIVFQDGTRYIIQTDIYKEVTDALPFATDFAEEIRSNANRFPLENGSTSAIGRSLHTGGLSKFSENVNRPSLEEMKRVERPVAVPVPAPKEPISNGSYDPWDLSKTVDELGEKLLTGDPLEESPRCVHGSRLKKEGVGKTGKPYSGWVCPDGARDKQCPPIWL
jgi:hypothetical protein